MPDINPSPNPRHENTKELRLALVCYGGVSLAIYMHGITKEIHKLVAASKAYENEPETNPFTPEQTEHVYWQALKQIETTQGVRQRVVVDIVAGTSAGGINGIFLAKALAHNLSQDPLRDLWLENGDISKLMVDGDIKKLVRLMADDIDKLIEGDGDLKKVFDEMGKIHKLRIAAQMVKILVRKRNYNPPLNGDLMLRLLGDALSSMEKTRPLPTAPPTLMPDDHTLELFVTITDFNGYKRTISIHDPQRMSDHQHRHVLLFTMPGDGGSQLDAQHNPSLAFAARATSCFPGAFPPINVENLEQVLGLQAEDLRSFESEFFRIYQLSDAKVDLTYFVDGGVLDNYPFAHAIQAITQKPASYEVNRRLIFIQPDPKATATELSGKPPGWLKTIWGALSTIPSNEPVVDDLQKVHQFNERVQAVNQLIDENFEPIGKELAAMAPQRGLLAKARGVRLENLRDDLHKRSAEIVGFAYNSYSHLKLTAVVDQLAAAICEVYHLPADSNQAFFIREAFRLWAEQTGIITRGKPIGGEQIDFLKTFDLGYSERRLRFVIQGINKLYDTLSPTTKPSRADLNTAKRELYALLGSLDAVIATAKTNPALQQAVAAVFGEKDGPTIQTLTDQEVPTFVAASAKKISQLKEQLGMHLNTQLANFRETLHDKIQAIVEAWPEAPRNAVLNRFVGFPFWDVLIYPIQRLSEVGELSEIKVDRMSPEDVKLLQPNDAKAKLRGMALGHFGAFFKRSYRENDYLWGRLDAAERLITMLLGAGASTPLCKQAFKTILTEERAALQQIEELIGKLEKQIDQLPG